LQCTKKLYLDLNTDINPWTNNLNRSLNKNMMMDYVKDYFVTKLENINLKQIFDKDEFLDNVNNENNFISFGLNLKLDDLSIKYDVITKVDNVINIYLAKSAIYTKTYYIKELTLQKYLISKLTDVPAISNLILINSDYKFTKSDINLDEYLNIVDCESRINNEDFIEVENNLKNIRREATKIKTPEIEIGSHCKNPYQCNYFDHCRINMPYYHVEQIPNQSKDQKQKINALGIKDIAKLPEINWLSDIQNRTVTSVKNSKAYIKPTLGSTLAKLKFPLYFMDFETIISPLPIFPNSFPFQPLPCMWSLHKLGNKGENLSYYNFYDLSGNDPRKDFIIKLIDILGKSGDILIYSDYEKRILHQIILSYPELKIDIENIISRCVDMLKLVRENYYHPGFRGSFSLKSVSKILPDGGIYNSEYVNSGDDASMVLMQLITGKIKKESISIYEQELINYAEKDTLNLVNLYNHLISVI